MLSLNKLVPEQAVCKEETAPATEKNSDAAAAKSQFVAFFQNKGFNCVTDAQQQLKAMYNKLTYGFR